MAILIDTSILGRLANRSDSAHFTAQASVAQLHRNGEVLHLSAQNLIEFRNFATRPVVSNGLGLTSKEAAELASSFEEAFPLLPDIAAIFPAWKALVEEMEVIGKQVHDARLVAICHAHGVKNLLTFNLGHFQRMASFGPGLHVIDPWIFR